VIWDGSARIEGNRLLEGSPVNFLNRDKNLDRKGDALAWRALTTGNYGGFDAMLAQPRAGRLHVETPLISFELDIAEIGMEDRVFDASGQLPRFIRVFRLPDRNPHRRIAFRREIPLRDHGDNAVYIRLTQADGTRAWTSPIYVFR
jgi:hypothetical protein